MTAERRDNQHRSGFLQWIRTVPGLDSREAGIAVMDVDIIWHQYRETQDNNGQRKTNNLMIIEEKSFGADLSFAQRDSMWITHQMLRDSRATFVSNARGQMVWVKYWGYFKLRYSGQNPGASLRIEWNKTLISIKQLIGILRFDLRPDNLTQNDRRRSHHAQLEKHPLIPGIEP